jgi:hypothetical protein
MVLFQKWPFKVENNMQSIKELWHLQSNRKNSKFHIRFEHIFLGKYMYDFDLKICSESLRHMLLIYKRHFLKKIKF